MGGDVNSSLLGRYRAAYGRWAPPLSSLSESASEAARMWWIAARHAGEDNPRDIAKEMRRQRFDLPRGRLAMDGGIGLVQPILLAEAGGSTFCVRGVADPRSSR